MGVVPTDNPRGPNLYTRAQAAMAAASNRSLEHVEVLGLSLDGAAVPRLQSTGGSRRLLAPYVARRLQGAAKQVFEMSYKVEMQSDVSADNLKAAIRNGANLFSAHFVKALVQADRRLSLSEILLE